MMIATPFLAGTGENAPSILSTVLKAILMIVGTVVCGRYAVPWVLGQVVRTRHDPELDWQPGPGSTVGSTAYWAREPDTAHLRGYSHHQLRGLLKMGGLSRSTGPLWPAPRDTFGFPGNILRENLLESANATKFLHSP